MPVRAMIRMSRRRPEDFLETAEVIEAISTEIAGVSSAFSFRVLDLMASESEVDDQKVKGVLKPVVDARVVQQDVIVALDFNDDDQVTETIERFKTLKAGAVAERSVFFKLALARSSAGNAGSAHEEITVSPHQSSEED